MSGVFDGIIHWSLDRDQDGHRDYTAQFQCHATDPLDGPGIILSTPGLPATGAVWAINNEYDPWAYCWPTTKVKPFIDKERQVYWVVEKSFTTRPFKRCQDTDVENPLAEPYRLSGTFIKFTKQGTYDRYGRRIQLPSFEPFRGSATEFDDNRPTVQVGFNTLILPLGLLAQSIDTLNDAPLWGLPPRTVKLCNLRWQRLVYGSCSYYYSLDLEFEINFQTWDRVVQNDATMVLKAGVSKAPEDFKPEDFEIAIDDRGNPRPVILTEEGKEWDGESPSADTPPSTKIEYYNEGDLMALGIPASL